MASRASKPRGRHVSNRASQTRPNLQTTASPITARPQRHQAPNAETGYHEPQKTPPFNWLAALPGHLGDASQNQTSKEMLESSQWKGESSGNQLCSSGNQNIQSGKLDFYYGRNISLLLREQLCGLDLDSHPLPKILDALRSPRHVNISAG
ncbi:hypothetical protein ACJ73_00518 [Blastomyces percursus]|uniref:Uncharacterized protein n=1 Tax=Blastomyces percursus TaxID=1658174 RepID=A0A1J9R6U4_9EURO|nr:hypothetical protein ACJ73_00518 [Blastomyces percursus]